MIRLMGFLLFLISLHHLVAGERRGGGSRAAGLAYAVSVPHEGVWACIQNPSANAYSFGTVVSTSVVPFRFGLRELRTIAVAGGFNIAGHQMSASMDQFGFDLYKEFRGTLGIGQKIAPSLAVGLSAEILRTVIPGYGNSNGLMCHVGAIVELSDDLALGLVANNILGAAIGIIPQRLPQIGILGLSYKPANGFQLIAEGEKDVRYDLTVRGGVEITVVPSLVLRGGIANNPDIVSTGFSIRQGLVECSYAASHHWQLGWTHEFEITLRFDP